MRVWRHVSLLSIKNSKLFLRSPRKSAILILTPVFVCLILFGFQNISDWVLSRSIPDPAASQLGVPSSGWLGKTTPAPTQKCRAIRLAYSPAGVAPWVDEVMREVGEAVGGVEPLFGGSGYSREMHVEYARMYDYLASCPNRTQSAVFWHSAFANTTTSTTNLSRGYTLFYNSSMKASLSWPFEFKLAIDRALLGSLTNRSRAVGAVEVGPMPTPTPRAVGYDVVAANGSTWFLVPQLVVFFMILTAVVAEKETRLRLGMRCMGLSDSGYWLSFGLLALLLTVVTNLLLIATGHALGFPFFAKTSFPAILLVFVVFGCAITSIALFTSTLVNRLEAAQTVGYSVIIILFTFQVILSSQYGALVDLLYGNVKPWVSFVRFLFQMTAVFNFAKVFSDIAVLSSNEFDVISVTMTHGPGFGWADLFRRRQAEVFGSKLTLPTPIDSVGLLCINTVFFLLLTWYLDNVLGGEHGTPRPPLFFLSRSYWSCCGREAADAAEDQEKAALLSAESRPLPADADPAVAEEARLAAQPDEDPANPAALRVVGLTKVYRSSAFWRSKDDVTALDNVSLIVESRTCHTLLGHNGAGKSTLIHYLAGLFPASAGGATIRGRLVGPSTRSDVGVCPQHDILWSELTAEEHMFMFARIKGLPEAALAGEVERALREVGLFKIKDDRVQTYSGGMKRRLSLAIAGLGNPSVVFLDEPTTGLDPVSRKAMWGLITRLKSRCAIILTTHLLDEAVVLSDRVSVLVTGRLRAIGTSLRLRRTFGHGYHVEASLPSAHAERTQALATLPAPSEVSASGRARWAGCKDVQALVEALEGHPAVKEFSVSQSSLEEVFDEVHKRHKFVYEDQDVDLAAPQPQQEQQQQQQQQQQQTQQSPHMFRALFRKNLALQKRQRLTNCCQIVSPLLVLLILLVLQRVVRTELGPGFDAVTFFPTRPQPLNHLNVSLGPEVDAFLRSSYNFVNPDFDWNSTKRNCLEFFWAGADPRGAPASLLGRLPAANASGSGLLGRLPDGPRASCAVNKTDHRMVPYAVDTGPSERTIPGDLYRLLQGFVDVPVKTIERTLPYSAELPDGALFFRALSNTSLDYRLWVNDAEFEQYHRLNFFTRVRFLSPPAAGPSGAANNFFGELDLTVVPARLALMDLVHKAFYEVERPRQASRDSVVFAQAFPASSTPDLLVVLELMGMFLFPIALSIQLPVYIYLLVLERSERLLHLMMAMGLRRGPYFVSIMAQNLTLYWAVVGIFWLVAGFGLETRLFSLTPPKVLFAFFWGWGLAALAICYFLASFLSSKQAAVVVGWVFAIMVTLLCVLICVGIYGPLDVSVASTMPSWFYLWPQFAFARGLYVMIWACATDACPSNFGPFGSDELTRATTFLYIDALWLTLAGAYIDAVLPRSGGIPKHPLFFLSFLWAKDGRRGGAAVPGAAAATSTTPLLEMMEEAGVDPGVAAERERARAAPGSLAVPVVTKGLRKVYPGRDKAALVGLDLTVSRGECLALLGENGCGKTTTVNLLTGLFSPTEGTALIGGFDVQSEMDQSRLLTGLCPQFSTLWKDLTVLEHVLFFARLKGVTPADEGAAVKRALELVGLLQHKDRRAGTLSGGMARRLALCLCLVGRTTVVLLDEPTTGLDPSSRAQLQNVVSRAKANRSVILLTHDMAEAALLADRIAIMASGSLLAIGTLAELKVRYCAGHHRLQIGPAPGKREQALRWALDALPGCTQHPHNPLESTLLIDIPPTTRISTVFKVMGRCPQDLVEEFGLNAVNLDNVFETLVFDRASVNNQD